MDIKWTTKYALKNIFANKKRSFLTMLGMVIGVGSVISIMAIGAGAESYVFSQLEVFGGNLIGVIPGGSEEDGPPASAFGIVITSLTLEDAVEIGKIPHIAAITPYANGNAKVTYGSKSKFVDFSGVTSGFLEVESSKVGTGRFIHPDEDNGVVKNAILGYEVANDFFRGANPIGEKIKIGQETFTIRGVMSKKGSSILSDQDNQIYIPIKAAQKLLLGINHISMIRAEVDAEENVSLVTQEIEKLLRKRHNLKEGVADDFTVRAMSQALDIIGSVTGAISLFLGAIAAISLLVGGVGIMNIMLVSVTERTREIGLRKAIGAKRKDIVTQFLAEAVLLTFSGGFIGILLGSIFSWVVAYAVSSFGYHWDFVVTPFSIALSVSVSVIIGVAFGLYPAIKASKLDAIESLRYE
ncbi:MAG: ABC transporter permease [Candidatus Pacebacteria bacterium]|nr:ABC transporter permease [Candidatus Paceibacterota bacterium]